MLIETAVGREEGVLLVVNPQEFMELFGAAIPCCTLQARAAQHEESLAGSISGAVVAERLREMGHIERPEGALLPDRFAERETV